MENNLEHHIDLSEHEIRCEKVSSLKKLGVEAWPEFKEVSTTTKKAFEAFEKTQDTAAVYQLAGRLMSKRDHGKTFFANLQDRDGLLQLYIKQSELGAELFDLFKKQVDIGDIVWVNGTLFVTKMGELTLHVTDLTLLSKCLHPLPEKYHGLVDVEQRYRQRYLDLISNPETKAKFKHRSDIIHSIRSFLQEREFIEVETPMLHPIPGGAAARPFVTHHNAYNMDLYLRIAPELYLKRLVIGGIERVFEINRNFRNEGISTRHNPEFTMLELYMAHGDYRSGIALTEALIRTAANHQPVTYNGHTLDFSHSFAQYTVSEALVHIGGFTEDEITENNIDTLLTSRKVVIKGTPSYGSKLFTLFEEAVESKIINPTFIIGHPVETSPLAKRDPEHPHLAARFELFVHGMEIANGFTELNDPFDQAERFKGQVASRESGDDEAHHYDADFVHALEYGLPPTVGVGIGIDRLTMLLTDTTSIKDVILFPTLKMAHE